MRSTSWSLCVGGGVGEGEMQALFSWLPVNSSLSSDFHEWWGHPGAGKWNSYFSNPIKAGIVCLRKQRPDGYGGRNTSGPPSGGRLRQLSPALRQIATGRRRGCMLKCKLKLDQQSAWRSQSMLRRESVQLSIYKLNPALSSSFRRQRSITAAAEERMFQGADARHGTASLACPGFIRPPIRAGWAVGGYTSAVGGPTALYGTLSPGGPPRNSLPPIPYLSGILSL